MFWNHILDILLRMELFTNTMFWQVFSTEYLTFPFNSPFKSSKFYVFDPSNIILLILTACESISSVF